MLAATRGSSFAFSSSGGNATEALPSLGGEARFRGAGGEILHARYFGLRPGLDVVHPDQRLACLDGLAFAHEDFLDQAAGRVLDSLLVGRDGDRAADRYALVERRQRRPQEKAADARDDDHPAQAGVHPGVGLHFLRCGFAVGDIGDGRRFAR